LFAPLMLATDFRSQAQPASPLIWLLLTSYGLALAYGSLYPFSGWRTVGGSWWELLLQSWSRYWTWLDVLANLALYMPLGLLLVLALRVRLGRLGSLITAVLVAAGLSGLLEFTQAFLPHRVPSTLDWLTNMAGAGLAAVLTAATPPRNQAWAGASAERSTQQACAVMLLVWLVCQITPQSVLFETGVLLPDWVGKVANWNVAGEQAQLLAEAMIVASMVVVIGVLLLALLRANAFLPFWLCLFIAAGTTVNIFSAKILHGSPVYLAAGAQAGLIVGALLLSLVAPARRKRRNALALLFLILAVVLGNLNPLSVYRPELQSTLLQPGLRNLMGLLSALNVVWPFAAALVLWRQWRHP
jgi:VanZ family protein